MPKSNIMSDISPDLFRHYRDIFANALRATNQYENVYIQPNDSAVINVVGWDNIKTKIRLSIKLEEIGE